LNHKSNKILNNDSTDSKITNSIIHDDPLQRQESTSVDLLSKENSLSKLRFKAIEKSHELDEKSHGLDESEDGPPISGLSNWVQIGPTIIPSGQTHSNSSVLATGRVTAIVVNPSDPNVIYVGSAQGGVWKTKDGGRNWLAISDYTKSLAVGALVIDPKDHSILYVGTGEGNLVRDSPRLHQPESYYGVGILKTTSAGEKTSSNDDKIWELMGGENNPFYGSRFFRLAINPLNTNIIFAATTFGLFRSVDTCKSWIKMKNDLPDIDEYNIIATTDIVINPDNPNIAYTAFWADGIYYTETAASDDIPHWRKLNNNGLPVLGFKRIALSISPSSPQIVYALMANDDGIIDRFYVTKDGGGSWKRIELPGMEYDKLYVDSIGPQGTYNINIAVDPTNSNIVYLSGISLWKAIYNASVDSWEFFDIGKDIHADHHALTFHPNNNHIVYVGTDGGIHKGESNNSQITWNDVINEGLCITQFEFMAQHPNTDAVVFAGTQDNGTLQFRNNPAFNLIGYGDGGFVVVDQEEPNIVIRQYVRTTLERSQEAGKISSWKSIKEGIEGNHALWYAPFTLDKSNSRNIAFGSDRVFLDPNQGQNKWRTPEGLENTITLPNLLSIEAARQKNLPLELVSAINYVNSDLIYVGTNHGKVFRLNRYGNIWKTTSLHDSPLPSLYIWDIIESPNDVNTVIVVMGGIGSFKKPLSHIWKGKAGSDWPASWTDISGNKNGRLPDIPINSIVIDPDNSQNIYIGTDIGVFRTIDYGKTWKPFSRGLPKCAVFDMYLYKQQQQQQEKLLRIITHGRGMWERMINLQKMPAVDIFIRDNVMDSGRFVPSPTNISAAFEDPLQHISLYQELDWTMCADIKVDSPFFYQTDTIHEVDYVVFENKLYHRNPKRGHINRIYVQIHNRGIRPAGIINPNEKVVIKLFYTNYLDEFVGGYPHLPKDFWTNFNYHNIKINSIWKQIGDTKFLPEDPKTITHTEPTVVNWEWQTPENVADKIWLLLIVDSPEDSILKENKIFDIEKLVRNEKHIGVRLVTVDN
jgi:hypothetical protein